jgi:hypothetical protein
MLRAYGSLLGAWLILAGCYGFSGSTLPPHLRTLRIHPVENRTLESSLPDKITQGLADGFRQRSNLRPVNQGGDAELFGVLSQYSHAPQSTAGDRVSTYRVDVLLQVLFIDRVKGDTLYRDERVPGYGFYAPERGETEETARQRAVENLVKVVLDNTVLAW